MLARLVDDTGTLIAASDWLGIVEWIGATDQLLEHVITAVADELSDLAALHTPLWFNVSPNDLIRPEGAEWLLNQLRRLQVPMAMLGVEMTETESITDIDRLAAAIETLRGEGIGVALDDFGVRNTPVGHLVKLPVSRVKLDGQLVAGVGESMPPSSWVVRSMAELAGRLGIEVIAEGVNSGLQMAMLARLGVPAAQGYLLGLPGPLARIPVGVDIESLQSASMSGIAKSSSSGPLVQYGAHRGEERRSTAPPTGLQR